MFASTLSIAAFVTIALRWRGPINVWESLYILPAAMGVGLLNSSQFIGLSATAQKEQLATTISTFFLSQQLGMMIGASVSAALLRNVFRSSLVKMLGSRQDEQVGAIKQISSRVPANYLIIQIIKDILSDTRIASSLPQALQGIVLSSYIQGFLAVAGKLNHSRELICSVISSKQGLLSL